MERRDFIRITGIGAAAAFITPSFFIAGCKKEMTMDMGGSIKVTEGDFSAQLAMPKTVLANGSSTMNAQITRASIIKGKTTKVFGYHESILGPTLKINKGETANISFNNSLAEETNIHWHGLLVSAKMDGHPENIVNAGGSFNYSFPITQRAGSYWYHPHPHGKTAHQVFMGLAGFFIVNDTEETALNLPSGNYEIPLVIQDKRIYSDYSLNYSATSAEVMTGYLGQYVCVNGIYSPYHNVATRWYRLRVLNGSTARVLNLALSNSANFYVIGSDAGLIASPASVNNLLLAPGERADLLIDFSSYSVGTEIFLQNNSFNGGTAQGGDNFKIMKFKIDKAETDTFALPASLSVITPIPTASSSYNRNFDLKQADHNLHSGMNMGSMQHTINGKSFDMNRIDFSVNAGATEIWTFDNSGSDDEIHPMHIHGVHFQVLDRTGGRGMLIPTETGWKDTVLCMPNEKVRVIMTFPQHKGKFVLHCHNLEHEDSGMMLNYEIL